jgi:putative ABC transport system substrate-binding protein
VLSDPTLFGAELHTFALRDGVPIIATKRMFAAGGGLMSYGPHPLDTARRAAYFVDRLLRGARPADLPVEEPTRYELVVNRSTAKALGLTIPPSLLVRADQVIE